MITFEQALQLKKEGFTVEEIKSFMEMDFTTVKESTSVSQSESTSVSQSESESDSEITSESMTAKDEEIAKLQAKIDALQKDNSSKDLSDKNSQKSDDEIIAEWAQSFM